MLMYSYNWYQWLSFFYVYCFFGWIFESTYVSLKKKQFVNRGFLRLPMLPLYGTGAVMMLWVSLPVKDNLVLVYIFGVIAATILEYVTGYMMERLFKMKYWDYSGLRFQLHGYICLSSSIAWGFLTIFLTEVIHRPIERMILHMNPLWEIALIIFVSAFFVADSIKSTKEAIDLGHALESITKVRAELEDVQLQLALLKAETVQYVEDYKEGTAQKVTQIKAGVASKLTELKDEQILKLIRLKEEQMLNLTKLKNEQMGFYRKSLLRGNPSSGSNKFNAALKELKETVSLKKRR